MQNNIRKINDNLYISDQPTIDSLIEIINKYNISLVINNRPDKEEVGQPLSLELNKICKKIKVKYIHQPIISYSEIRESDKIKFKKNISKQENQNILAFCRTGRRSEGLL